MSRLFQMTKPCVVTLVLALAPQALAQTPGAGQTAAPVEPAAAENGRYTMTPAPGGFLRLDTRTGAVALCTVKGPAVTCAASAD